MKPLRLAPNFQGRAKFENKGKLELNLYCNYEWLINQNKAHEITH